MSIFSNIANALFKPINKILGDELTYTYKVGGSDLISAVFENAYIEVQGVSTLKPILRNVVRSELDHVPVKGDSVSIGGVAYRVVDPQSDGLGSYLLILEKT